MNNYSSQESSLDQLLNQVKSDYQNKPSDNQKLQDYNSQIKENHTEDIFKQVKSDFKQKKAQSTNNNSSKKSDNLLANIKGQYQTRKQKQSHSNQIQINLSSERSQNLLSDIRNQYQTQKQSQSNNLQTNQEEIRYAEQKRQQQRKLLTRKAENWLKNLDPSSDEGFWFEEFALSYPSKLEAAIDYLAALDNPS